MAARFRKSLSDASKSGEVKFKLGYKNLPLPIHKGAMLAARAALAANLQGRFWELHDGLFEWSSTHPNRSFDAEQLESIARQAGVDLEKWRTDLSSREVVARLDQDLAEARDLQIKSVPSFTVNGAFYSGMRTPEQLGELFGRTPESEVDQP